MPPSQVEVVAAEIPNLVKMIAAKRADLIITTQEEVALYVDQAELKLKDFRVLIFPDVPAVEMRYILCSKQVPEDTMQRLNKAIGKFVR
jgi:polar amino acid transport system substrate-binding protein